MHVIMCPDRQQPAMHNANFVFPCPGKTCSTINSLCTKITTPDFSILFRANTQNTEPISMECTSFSKAPDF